MKEPKVVVHAAERYESSVRGPLGADTPPHRIWTWPDGSWVLIRFLHDGGTRAVTSAGLSANLVETERALHVRVARLADAHRSEGHSDTTP